LTAYEPVVLIAVDLLSRKRQETAEMRSDISIMTCWSIRLKFFGLLNSRNLYELQVILAVIGMAFGIKKTGCLSGTLWTEAF